MTPKLCNNCKAMNSSEIDNLNTNVLKQMCHHKQKRVLRHQIKTTLK